MRWHLDRQPEELPRDPTRSHAISRDPTRSHAIPRDPTQSHAPGSSARGTPTRSGATCVADQRERAGGAGRAPCHATVRAGGNSRAPAILETRCPERLSRLSYCVDDCMQPTDLCRTLKSFSRPWPTTSLPCSNAATSCCTDAMLGAPSNNCAARAAVWPYGSVVVWQCGSMVVWQCRSMVVW
jgi:hypothetical protein